MGGNHSSGASAPRNPAAIGFTIVGAETAIAGSLEVHIVGEAVAVDAFLCNLHSLTVVFATDDALDLSLQLAGRVMDLRRREEPS